MIYYQLFDIRVIMMSHTLERSYLIGYLLVNYPKL